MYVAVIGSTGKKLQPTSSYRARKLLNSKRTVFIEVTKSKREEIL